MTVAAPGWRAPSATGPLAAVVRVPGSKSATNRALVLSALAAGTSVLSRPLRARDTLAMADGLRALGVAVEDVGEPAVGRTDDRAWRVTGCPGPLQPVADRVDCGQAGTVARFLLPVAGLAEGTVTLDGTEQLRRRPLGPLLQAVVGLGLQVSAFDGRLPVTVHGRGRVRGGSVVVDASASSQFVSALLLAGARFERGVDLRLVADRLPSAPHVSMTLDMLAEHGAEVDVLPGPRWLVQPGGLTACDRAVEPDLSGAAVFLAAAAVAGGTVTVAGWPAQSSQPGALVADLLAAMGAVVRATPEGLAVTGDQLHGLDVDLSGCGELVPVVAAAAALADSPSRLRGVGHLRGHETDRLAALTGALNGLGGDVRETEDGLLIRPRPLRPGAWPTHDDHRMAMAGALVGLVVPGVVLDDAQTTAKTYPGFPRVWAALVGHAPAPEVTR